MGNDSIAASLGKNGRAKASKWNWIILSEIEWDSKNKKYEIKDVKSAKVDGKKIKADVWYELKWGKFVEVAE